MSRIKLNVSGKRFETTVTTLVQSSGYFKTLLSGQFASHFDKNQVQIEEVFIDRSALGFKHVLSLLQDSQYPFPGEFQYELEYYQIDYSKEEKLHFDPEDAKEWGYDGQGWSSNCRLVTEEGIRYTSQLKKNDKLLTVNNTYSKILEIIQTRVLINSEIYLFQMVNPDDKKKITVDRYGDLSILEYDRRLPHRRGDQKHIYNQSGHFKKLAFVSEYQMIKQTVCKSEWKFAKNLLLEKIRAPSIPFNRELFFFNVKLENGKEAINLFLKNQVYADGFWVLTG